MANAKGAGRRARSAKAGQEAPTRRVIDFWNVDGETAPL